MGIAYCVSTQKYHFQWLTHNLFNFICYFTKYKWLKWYVVPDWHCEVAKKVPAILYVVHLQHCPIFKHVFLLILPPENASSACSSCDSSDDEVIIQNSTLIQDNNLTYCSSEPRYYQSSHNDLDIFFGPGTPTWSIRCSIIRRRYSSYFACSKKQKSWYMPIFVQAIDICVNITVGWSTEKKM